MATTGLQTIRNGLLAIGLCASLAAGSLGFAPHAEARMPQEDPGVGVVSENLMGENALGDNALGDNAMSDNALSGNSMGAKERKGRR